MAGSIEGGTRPRGRRKAADADLNLVPYIDLLTCMIAFLLIAAVWTQLARLHVAQKGQGESGESVVPQAKLAILVHEGGFTLIVNNEQQPLPLATAGRDFQGLTDQLKRVKQSFPDKTDVQVLSDDAIKFETLVQTMDAAMAAGFPDIALQDATTAAAP